ncbi:MAG: hypothetical protein ABIH26_13510, partial [Candidatus Eisenbacteria bacterium]
SNVLLANLCGFPLAASVPIEFSPSYAADRTLFGHSETRVFRSEDGGLTWEALLVPTPDYDLPTRARLAFLRLKRSRLMLGLAALAGGALAFLCLSPARNRGRPSGSLLVRTAASAGVAVLLLFLLSVLRC